MSADQTPAADPTPGSSRVDVAGLRDEVLAAVCSVRAPMTGDGLFYADDDGTLPIYNEDDTEAALIADAVASVVAARLATAEAEIERLRDLALGDEQCCGDVCNGGACEGCLGCQAGWCVNGHDFSEGEWERMSAEDREQWWDVAREHNVGIDAALKRAEVAERQRCSTCGAPWQPVRRGECLHCGSDAGPQPSPEHVPTSPTRAQDGTQEPAGAPEAPVEPQDAHDATGAR